MNCAVLSTSFDFFSYHYCLHSYHPFFCNTFSLQSAIFLVILLSLWSFYPHCPTDAHPQFAYQHTIFFFLFFLLPFFLSSSFFSSLHFFFIPFILSPRLFFFLFFYPYFVDMLWLCWLIELVSWPLGIPMASVLCGEL